MLYRKFALIVFVLILLFVFVSTPDKASVEDSARAADYCSGKEKYPPKKFTSDVCSRWPDGEWGSCCMEHDIKYWCGGETSDRLAADLEIQSCINKIKPGMGTLMFWGIRAGGTPWLPTPYRWGYGWSWPDSGN
ncbi:MAG: hypothetical protein M3M85_02675 [bacterium]|nr:hypothetical protein [bacterium]